MTMPRFLVGVVLIAVAVGPLAAGAWALRARMLGWVGVPARVVEVVVGCSTLVVVSELLGLVGLYRVAPVVIGLAAAGAVELWWGRRPGAWRDDEHVVRAPRRQPKARSWTANPARRTRRGRARRHRPG